ncbi:MAG TPA: ATP-binding protein [Candidatus Acidoferrales bacterium]|jgi:two-component system nitrogen regulation sensor histidine kinase NtrY|nr:ATP-binding protein [Candidatus Acidoferrales bacterium]
MKKRLLYGFASVLLVLSVLVVVWQGSFNKELQRFGPVNPQQTFLFWAISSLVVILMLVLGWNLAREAIKLYVARQSNRLGSRIRTKLVLGALALSFLPVFFLVFFSYEVLNLNFMVWFTNPVENQINLFVNGSKLLDRELENRLNSQAELLAGTPEVRSLLAEGTRPAGFLATFCQDHGLDSAVILPATGDRPLDASGPYPPHVEDGRTIAVLRPVKQGDRTLGYVSLSAAKPIDVARQTDEVRMYNDQWAQVKGNRKNLRTYYIMLMALIALFVLFFAQWIARILANRISVPITALLDAASEVRRGNLKHRVNVSAEDELAILVRGFNQMTEELETSAEELDRRRRFTEAILESIPTGVISVGPDGSIQRVNRALSKIFPAEQAAKATRLEDLFSREDTAEIKYLMKRARRTGVASRELVLRTENRKLHLAVTVAALEEKLTSGFVVVLEDTSELLRAQKSAAWREVARRVAHEIKNPLTPIALSAERISRQLDRLNLPPGTARIVYECAATISKSVDSVKTLVDEFSQFARFPGAQPVRSDLNQVVAEALAVFQGRLEGIAIRTSFAPGLPPVNLDREQFQRVVVNLVDNAAEAMQDALVKNLYIATQPGAAETVELVIADSGCGVSPDDKEKLFLPYFSTKNRGTGLGLAIVSHIVAEHNAQIRVEDNQPVGARFTVELHALVDTEAAEPATRPAAAPVTAPVAAKV